MISKKHKTFSTTLSYMEHFLLVASTIAGCVSIPSFATLVGIPVGITSSAIGFKIYVITAGIKSISQ